MGPLRGRGGEIRKEERREAEKREGRKGKASVP